MAKKSARRKMFMDDLARQRHSAHRRSLVRSEKERQKKELERGRSELERASLRQKETELFRRNNMISRGLASRLDAVGKSMGVNVRTTIRPGREVAAHTIIGQSIEVVHDRRLTAGLEKDGTVVTDSVLQEIAIETRGFYYHEVGHNLFTTPLMDLLTLAVANGYPVTDSGFSANPNYAPGADFSAKRNPFEIQYQFHQAWNILEDQRMEAAMIQYSPVLKNYFTVMVMRNMVDKKSPSGLNNWLLLAGRRYLPDHVRDLSRSVWDLAGRDMTASGISADEIEKLVSRYMAATTAVEMVQCTQEFADAIVGAGVNHIGSHTGIVTRSNGLNGEQWPSAEEFIEDTVSRIEDSSVEDDDEDDDEDDTEGDDLNGSSGSPTVESTDSEDAQKGSSIGDQSSPRPSTSSERKKAFEDALKDAVDALREEQSVQEDVKSMNSSYADDESLLPQYHRISEPTTNETYAKAAALADDIEQSFRVATQQAAPRWESQQRRGVLEPMRYLTRQPGDMEFFRNYVDHGDPGSDIAVSVFLDISGSMDGSEEALGIAAWAMKTACDRLNIECDITLFDDQAFCLWSTSDRPEFVPVIDCVGGTSPSQAFRAVLSDERKKAHHLVLAMTDGDWAHGVTMNNHKNSNSYNVLFFYDTSDYTRAESDLAYRLGADEGFYIDDLSQMPVALESLLLSMV